jgi:hypothetical protein
MHNTLSSEEAQAGYKLLFDGKTLNGWDVTGSPEGWGVEDGCIACMVKKGRYLFTDEQYGDFKLHAEFKTEPGVNSGIFFRVSDLSDLIHNGLEMQILDTYDQTELGKKSCGAVYDLQAPSANAAKPAGEWNDTIIECRGSRVQITLNGRHIIDMNLDDWPTAGQNPDGTTNKFRRAIGKLPHTGRICLQDHQGKAWFRNIKLLPLA